jgi:EmrB/QacA subfamily drug resistance transporter
MAVLDSTIVNVALPAIRRSLALSLVDLQWVMNAYLLTFGGLLLLGGRLGDHFGRKRLYLIGSVVFSLASLAGGFAPSGATLIAARAVQGIGAALLTPGTLSLLTAAYPDARKRTRAIGIWSASAGSAASIGVLLGGVLTQALNWRWVLFVNVPLGVLVLVLGGAALVESRGSDDGGSKRLDVPGALLITAAMTLLVYAVVDTDVHPWGSTHTLVALGASAALLAIFVIVEARTADALMPLGVFRRRAVASGVFAVSLFGVLLTGAYYFLSLYFQGPRGLSPLDAGLAFLPATVVSVMGSAIASQLVPRFGPRIPLAFGLTCSTLALLWLSRVAVGMCFVCSTVLVTAAVERSEAGLASGLLNAGRQIGGSIGLAALSVIAATRTHALLALHPGASLAAAASGDGRAFLVCGAVGVVAVLTIATLARVHPVAVVASTAVAPPAAPSERVPASAAIAQRLSGVDSTAMPAAPTTRVALIAPGERAVSDATARPNRVAMLGLLAGVVALVVVLVRATRRPRS